MYMDPNDKGWLRQRLPKAKPDQLYRFIEGVGNRLDHIASPTAQQTEAARAAAFRDLMGVSA